MTLASQLKLAATVITSSWLAACASADYTPLTFTPKGDHFVLNGVIDELSLEDFNLARQAHPEIKHLVFENIPGSVDDETNLKLARKIRSLGMTTELPEGGLVASGGTDLFLAGTRRTMAENACVGVHAWAYEEDGEVLSANQIPRDAIEHSAYTRYYQAMGIEPNFYWYTLAAAPYQGMHWMSFSEIKRYKMAQHYQLKKLTARPIDCDAIEEP